MTLGGTDKSTSFSPPNPYYYTAKRRFNIPGVRGGTTNMRGDGDVPVPSATLSSCPRLTATLSSTLPPTLLHSVYRPRPMGFLRTTLMHCGAK
jgi:hypothetical protein